MSDSNFKNEIDAFRHKVESCLNGIFASSEKELFLALEGESLLDDECNCLESSTAFGFLLEEYVVSKLCKELGIKRTGGGTATTSYDCSGETDGKTRVLINVKVCRSRGRNDAVAAISALKNDFIDTDRNVKKCFLVLKVHYDVRESQRAEYRGSRVIFVRDVESYFLDEVDFSKEHRQDHRSWSGKANDKNAGRLIVTDGFRKNHKVASDDVSYENTIGMIEAIIKRNELET